MRIPQPAGMAPRAPAPDGRAQRAVSRWGETLTVWSIWTLLLASACVEVLGQTELVNFGFYTLHIVDPPVVLAFLAWACCLARRLPKGGIVAVPALLIAALVLTSFVRGMATDAAPALLWARANLTTAALLLLATTCDLSRRVERGFRRALIVSGGIVAGLTLLRLMFGPGLFMLNPAEVNVINDGGRAVTVNGAFVIGLAATLLLSDVLRPGGSHRTAKAALLVVYAVMEVASGQGTASAAMLVMLAVSLMLERGPLRGTRAALGAGLLLIVPVIVLIAFDPDQLLTSHGGIFDIAHRADNLETRATIWAALKLGFSRQPPIDQMFGMPAGQMPDMIVYMSRQLSEWRLSIHSMYYGSLPVMGYVGLSAYIFLLVVLSLGSLVSVIGRRGAGSAPVYPLAMCAGTAILSYSYEIRLAAMMGLFVAIWWYRAARSPGRSTTRGQTAVAGIATQREVSRAVSAQPARPRSRPQTARPSPRS